MLQEINQNIEKENYEENVQAAANWLGLPSFQSLNCLERGRIYNRLGVSYYLLNREQEAIQLFKKAVGEAWDNCSSVDQVEQANTIYNIGVSYQYSNDFVNAKKYLDESLSIFEKAPDYPPAELADKYHGLGNFYHDNYDLFRAELYYEAALKSFGELPDKTLAQFDVLNELMAMSTNFRQFEKAKAYYAQALRLYQEQPTAFDPGDLFSIYQNMGIAHFGLKEFPQALEKGRLALQLVDKSAFPVAYALVVEMLGVVKLELEAYDEAILYFEEALQIRQGQTLSLESRKQRALAYENLGDAYIRKGKMEKAEYFLDEGIQMLVLKLEEDQTGLPIINQSVSLDDQHFIRILELKAAACRSRFEKDQTIEHLITGLSIQFKIDTLVNRALLSLPFQRSKLELLSLLLEHYESAIEEALQLHRISGESKYLETAYYFSAKTKAIVLQYELNQSSAFQSVASAGLVREEKRLREQLEAARPDQYMQEGRQDSLLLVYLKAQRDLDRFILEVERKEPVYFQQKYAFIHPPSLQRVREDLTDDLVIIEYFYGSDTIYSFWITKTDFFCISIPNSKELRDNIQGFVTQCHDPDIAFDIDIAHGLYRNLIREGQERLSGDFTRFCIIPDGSIHEVSFDALLVESREKSYLLEEFSIFYAYSISLLLHQEEYDNQLSYVGFGTTYSTALTTKLKANKMLFGEERLSPLVLAADEISEAIAIFEGQAYLNGEATLANFYTHSGAADIIHLSLHGLVDKDDPARSCVIFDDKQTEFLLTAAHLSGHEIAAELVILSACHTASGKIYNGEGVQGMSKAFLLSGANSILSSLWSASEASSLTIMTRFLAALRQGQAKDLALQQAKLGFLNKTGPSQQHPYYWANYLLIGEETAIAGGKNPIPWVPIIAGCGLLLLVFQRFRVKKLKIK